MLALLLAVGRAMSEKKQMEREMLDQIKGVLAAAEMPDGSPMVEGEMSDVWGQTCFIIAPWNPAL